MSGIRDQAGPPQSSADLDDWNRVASAYAEAVGSGDDRINSQLKRALWECLGDVRGLNVLDLGCGHGWLSAALAEAGAARVLGIDGSAELLRIARASFPGIRFVQHDLCNGLPMYARGYHRVVAHMLLMDIPEIGPLIRGVRSALRGDGRFIFTLPHPCFFNHGSRRDEATGRPYCAVTGYLQPAVWRIESYGGHNHYHRSLTWYVDHLRANGLCVTRLYEPPHIPGPDVPDLQFARQIPRFLLVEAVHLLWRRLTVTSIYHLEKQGALIAHLDREGELPSPHTGFVDLVIGEKRVRMRCHGVGHLCGRSSGCTPCVWLVPASGPHATIADIKAFLGLPPEPDLYTAPGMYLERVA